MSRTFVLIIINNLTICYNSQEVINSLFGENLRKLRKEKNLTQKQLAEHLE